MRNLKIGLAYFFSFLPCHSNKHWLSDVIAGAGIGILSAKAGYWLYPYTSRLFTKKNSTNTKTAMLPFYDGKTVGFGFVKTF